MGFSGVLKGQLDATLDKYKHTQQGTAWRSLWESIASLSPKTLTSTELNSPSFSVTIIRVSFTHLSANCLLLPPTALSHNNTSFLAQKSNKKLSPELWQCPHDHLAGGSMTMMWQASPQGDCTHQSLLLTRSTPRGAPPHQGRFLGAGSCSWWTILKQQKFSCFTNSRTRKLLFAVMVQVTLPRWLVPSLLE